MKKAILLILVAVFISPAMAQQDPQAKEVLDKVSKKTSSYTTITAEFSYKLENKTEGISDAGDGKILLKGSKYKLNFMGNDIYFDGKYQTTHLIEAQEAQIVEPDADSDKIWNPAMIFTIYESGFKYQFIGEKTENDKQLIEIDLVPEKPDERNFSRVKLKTDKATDQIYSIQTFGNDGNIYTITLKSLTPNTEIADKTFVFDPAEHPDVDVIDLR